MPSSSSAAAAAEMDSIASRRKRRNSRPPPPPTPSPPAPSSTPRARRFRRKKQKRLDAIRDYAGSPAPSESTPLRRSTRVRRPPALPDPSISPRRTHRGRRVRDLRESRGIASRDQELEDGGNWGLRLRSRGKVSGSSAPAEKSKRRLFDDEVEFLMPVKRKKVVRIAHSVDVTVPDQVIDSPVVGEEEDVRLDCGEKLEASREDAAIVDKEDVVDGEADRLDSDKLEEQVPRGDEVDRLENDKLEEVVPSGDAGLGSVGEGVEQMDGGNEDIAAGKNEELEELKMELSGERIGKGKVREGRRCGLCGGGVDGKPPNELVRDCGESENEAYGSSPLEEPNYDMWDGFGDEPGWLGPLLGPTHDRFGIARVWVHQHCAVWSPEVYFAGYGRLKNVRAALYRGRALKCSRCGRPGATIGCRVDRCPKTYHLPCARAKGSIFDHRKFLIACPDHRHLFEPHGLHRLRKIRKLKAKKLRLQMRKLSNDASRKDVEAEEKWLENCGEDEEFLKREGRRLHRDLARIAPVYIGGDSPLGKKELYDGFESVAGLQDVIQCMKEVVILPLLYPEFFKSMGLTPPRGVLLHGYPGTGKTLVVRALIGACSRGDKRIAYFARKGADCLGKYVGDAERQLRLLFQVAERSQPSIIFFDEIDGLAPCRSRRQDQTHNSVVSTLLALLDGLKSRGSVMVIGATNRPDALDPALRRPGRFDREIYFPLPSVKDRSSIISLHTQKWPKPVIGPLLKWLSERTVGYAGADLQALCTQAVMISLKRKCALQELMAEAEKFGCSKCPPLPSLIVEECDWLAALAHAPPPCSRRDAATCANDVIFSPLKLHLSQCLMYPVTHLLLSLYLDERIWLPPTIEKASKLVTNVVFTALKQRKVHSVSWSDHLSFLVQESEIAKQVEGILYCTGLLSGYSSFLDSEALENKIVDKMNCPDLKSSKLDSFETYFGQGVLQRVTVGRTSGYRILFNGKPKCGQQHVAACLLQGFVGYTKVVKVSFATIVQEGHGDILQGITQILLRCLSVGRCIIYMPRIDLWAFEVNEEPAGKDNLCSETWKSFVEQVDSRGSSTPLIILATCETHISLPNRVKEFFTWCMGGSSLEYTIPRFSVHFDGKFDCDLFLSASTRSLSRELVKYYVQLMHQKNHASKSCVEHKEYGANNAELEPNPCEFVDNSAHAVGETKQQVEHSPRGPQGSGVNLRPWPGQDITSRFGPNKTVKGKSNVLYSISTFGYQILRYPHFKELCWATSKLEDGPSADIDGTWKGWPFNICFVRPNPVVDKESGGGKNKENYVVRGLVAVGLLAYKGMYASSREVLLDVRKVLELLVEDIDSRISAGKDRFNFFHLLSQVAYLDDMVINWAYALRSSGVDTQVIISNTESGKWDARNTQIDNKDLMMDGEGLPIGSSLHGEKVGPSMQEGSSPRSVQDSLNCISCNGCSHDGLPDDHLGHTFHNSVEKAMPISASNIMATHGVVSRDPETLTAVAGCSVDMDIETSQNGGNKLPIMSGSSYLYGQSSSMSESFAQPCTSDSAPSQVLGNLTVREETRHLVEPVASDADTESLCHYICCSQCVHKLSEWLHAFILKRWESNGCDATIEGINDVVETCSLNLLAAVKASFNVENGTIEGSDRTARTKSLTHIKKCSCQLVLDSNALSSKEAPKHYGTQPVDCYCHPESNGSSPVDLRLEFLFRDSTLVPLDQDHDSLLHCRYDSLCTCSAFASILASVGPSD